MKRQKRLLSLLLSLVMLLTLLPPAAQAAETTVTLTAGGHYRLVNTNTSSVTVKKAGESGVTYDYIRYKADGSEDSYDQNASARLSSDIYLPAGASYILSAHGEMTLTLPDGVTIDTSSTPALVTYTLEAGKNYKLTNHDPNNYYGVKNDAKPNNKKRFDAVLYKANGAVVDSGLASIIRDQSGDFFVEKGGWEMITIHDEPISGFLPYARKDLLTFEETTESALVWYTLQAGQTYTLVNHDPAMYYGVNSDAAQGRTYDFELYKANGGLVDNGLAPTGQGSFSNMFVQEGGRSVIKINEQDIHCYIPYTRKDILTFTNASGAPLSYTANLTGSSGNAVEYIYDTVDPAASLILPVKELEKVKDQPTAVSAVRTLTSQMTSEQKSSPIGMDLAALYAETATAKAAKKAVSGNEVIINAAAVAELETIAKATSDAVETALVSGGVATARYLSNTVTLTTNATGEISIKIDPDILTTEVDKIRVETPTYALTLKTEDLKADLTEVLTITTEDTGAGYAAGKSNGKTVVSVNLPKGKTSNPVTLSLPTDKSDTTYQAVVTTAGKSTSSKYNPATVTMDGKINASGSYTVQTNEKDFTDIASKSAEMQAAIRYLASKGIINGKTSTTFDPDGSINRAEIAALLVRALGKLDNSAANSFTDVKSSDWYYAAAGSSQKNGLIKGYNDKTFRGLTTINRVQIVAVASRVLMNEMGYTATTNTASYLGKYSDTVDKWAQGEVALATRENLVVYRTDGTFSGTKNMTRGDAAIIIYRLFQRIW